MNRRNIRWEWLILILLLILPPGCKPQEDIDPHAEPELTVPSRGSASHLEVVSWNLKNFPLKGDKSIELMTKIVPQLDLDLYALQEIEDTESFQKLIDQLPAYDAVVSSHQYSDGSYQKLAVMYKRDHVIIEAVDLLFIDDHNAFPRPPLLLKIKTARGNTPFDFNLIVLHLKAFDNDESRERRRRAVIKLKSYIDTKIAENPNGDADYIVAGDWNDELTDPDEENIFTPFLNSALYRFLSYELSLDPSETTYPSYPSFIDHILISIDAETEYGNGNTKIIYLNRDVTAYATDISDHLPIMAAFPVF